MQRCILYTLHWIYSKRTLRLTGQISLAVRLTEQRIVAHLILIQDKIISFLGFQGKSTDLHDSIRQALAEML